MGCEPAKVDFDDKLDSRSVEELVLSLKPEFQLSKFELVASILASREEKLKREIEAQAVDLCFEREQARLDKIKLEDELKLLKEQLEREGLQAEIKVKAVEEMEVRVNKIKEGMMRLGATQQPLTSREEGAGSGEVRAPPPPENRGESGRLAAEGNGNGIASGSGAGVEKVDGNKQLSLEIDVKKEKEDLVSGAIEVCKRVDEREKLISIEMNVKKENEEQKSGGGGEIGATSSANLKSLKADTRAANQATTKPTPAAGDVVEISDSEDESTPPKAGTSKQPHAGAGHSGKVAAVAETVVLKRKSTSSGPNDNSSGRPEKLTKHQDFIHFDRTAAAQATTLVSPKIHLAALAALSSSSSSSSSDDEFDPSAETTFKPCI